MKIQNTKGLSGDRIKMLIYGESGVGKTTLARTINAPALIISAEAGLLSLNDCDIDVIDLAVDDEGKVIPKEKRFAKLIQVYAYLNTKECIDKYEWIFIDSLTEISQNVIEALYVEYPDRKDTLPMYGENNKRMRALIKAFRDLPHYNVVFTALAASVRDEDNIRGIGIVMVGRIAESLPGFFDEVFYMTSRTGTDGKNERILVTEKTDRIIAKDRSGKLKSIEDANLAVIASKIRGENNAV